MYKLCSFQPETAVLWMYLQKYPVGRGTFLQWPYSIHLIKSGEHHFFLLSMPVFSPPDVELAINHGVNRSETHKSFQHFQRRFFYHLLDEKSHRAAVHKWPLRHECPPKIVMWSLVSQIVNVGTNGAVALITNGLICWVKYCTVFSWYFEAVLNTWAPHEKKVAQ